MGKSSRISKLLYVLKPAFSTTEHPPKDLVGLTWTKLISSCSASLSLRTVSRSPSSRRTSVCSSANCCWVSQAAWASLWLFPYKGKSSIDACLIS